MGRSRDGFGTEIHAGVTGPGLPARFTPTPGQAADATQAATLLEGVPFEGAIADKGYDSNDLVRAVEATGGEAGIPRRSNAKSLRAIDR